MRHLFDETEGVPSHSIEMTQDNRSSELFD